MHIDGWRYYNHAAIPIGLPHESVNTTPVLDGSIWKLTNQSGDVPLLARWTENYDCGYETGWWYVIKEGPFDIGDVSAKERKSIRQALRKCEARQIRPEKYGEELYRCFRTAFAKYENSGAMLSKEAFIKNAANSDAEYWGGFDTETGLLIGYMTVGVHSDCVEIQTAKFDPEFANRQVSDALYYAILDYYLNQRGMKYASSGSRNISHKTNTQEYKIRRFGFRKVYCRLCIAYRPGIGFVVKVLYVFRKLLRRLDKIRIIHLVNGILMMEEICRKDLRGGNA